MFTFVRLARVLCSGMLGFHSFLLDGHFTGLFCLILVDLLLAQTLVSICSVLREDSVGWFDADL